MKFLCIAVAFFAIGFCFPILNPTLQIFAGLTLFLGTFLLLFNLFDDHAQDISIQ